MMKRVLLALLAAFSLTAQAQQKVTLGVVTALSGPLAAPGKFQMNGFPTAYIEDVFHVAKLD